MRDSLLFIAGRLDTTIGGRPIDLTVIPLIVAALSTAWWTGKTCPRFFARSTFLCPINALSGGRATSVPQQALFALNSPFVMEQARAVAARPEIALAANLAARVDGLFRLVLGRHTTNKSALRRYISLRGEC